MSIKSRRTVLRFWIQMFVLFSVLGLFFVACGGSDPVTQVTNHGCDSNYTYCSGSGKCCPNGYPYHCNTGTAAGTCYQNQPTNPPCQYYDYCSG